MMGRYYWYVAQSNSQYISVWIYKLLVEMSCTRVGKANPNTNQLQGGTRSAKYQKKVTRRKRTSVDLEV